MRHNTVIPLCLSVVLALAFSLFTLPAHAEADALLMATTTSTDNTGLLDTLIPEFTRETGIAVKWVATGTGKALKLGENCDADVLLVHAPAAEKKFISSGYGYLRREIMANDFIIIGPASDPAAIKGKTINQALKALGRGQSVFVSRGDNSGTHKKEIELWQKAGMTVPEKSGWYLETGQGMLATIRIAAERNGYTLADRGTTIKYHSQKPRNPILEIMVEKDAVLTNQYSVIPVDPDHCPNVKFEEAMMFSDWLAGKTGQDLIEKFRLMGQVLFIPNAK